MMSAQLTSESSANESGGALDEAGDLEQALGSHLQRDLAGVDDLLDHGPRDRGIDR